MDFTSIIGIVLCFVLIVYGIGLGALGNFWDVPSFILVVCGTIAAVVFSFPFKILKDVPKHFGILFKNVKWDPMKYIDTIVEFAQIARKSGLLALEEKANAEDDQFLKSSVLLIVDAVDADKIRQMLEGNIANLSARHEEGISVYEKGASLAPAFGMIGTIIGLVNMLKSMDMEGGGMGELAVNMSVALITTFYGAVIANAICLPMATKLGAKHTEELLCREIILEGVLSIQSGENPKYIREKLTSFLKQKVQIEAINKADGGGEK